MNLTRPFRFAAALSLAALAFAAIGCTQSNDYNGKITITRSAIDGLPTVTATQKTTGEATVTTVNYDKRTVTLKGPDGKPETFNVPASVVNFKQIKEGDLVKVKYTETIEANVSKAGSDITLTEAAVIATAPLGDKPGIFAYRTVEAPSTVQAIDYEKRSITLLPLDGKPVTFTVSKLLTNFENVKVGDHVIFTYSESLTIDVTGK